MEDFIHLHVHSQYSLLDGQASIQKMVEKAIGNEMRGMALTDHGNMFGVKDFFDCCNSVNKKRKKEGLEPFKPIFGCEVYVARRKKEQMSDPTIDRSGNHLILLAKNQNGYRNLIKLVSRAGVDGFYYAPGVGDYEVDFAPENLVAGYGLAHGNNVAVGYFGLHARTVHRETRNAVFETRNGKHSRRRFFLKVQRFCNVRHNVYVVERNASCFFYVLRDDLQG